VKGKEEVWQNKDWTKNAVVKFFRSVPGATHPLHLPYTSKSITHLFLSIFLISLKIKKFTNPVAMLVAIASDTKRQKTRLKKIVRLWKI